jgi:hypothetical protein
MAARELEQCRGYSTGCVETNEHSFAARKAKRLEAEGLLTRAENVKKARIDSRQDLPVTAAGDAAPREAGGNVRRLYQGRPYTRV